MGMDDGALYIICMYALYICTYGSRERRYLDYSLVRVWSHFSFMTKTIQNSQRDAEARECCEMKHRTVHGTVFPGYALQCN